MPTGLLVPVEEYLRTAYHPDCEYIDGEVLERNVGEFPHSWLQGLLHSYLMQRRKRWGITPILEQRIKISETRYRIPDICVFRGGKPLERILTRPPLLWIEILSSQDRPIRVQRKVEDVIKFGAEYVWVIDPDTLESYVYTASAQYELADGTLRIPGTEIAIPLSGLDED